MAPTPQRPGWGETIAKWLGLQVAAKAVSVALGAPVVVAGVMATLAYTQGLPLAWGFLAVVLAAAGASTVLNQARSFMLAYSVANKIYTTGVDAVPAADSGGKRGYGISIHFQNSADIPLEYRVRRSSAHLDGRIASVSGPDVHLATDGDIIEAGGRREFVVGLVPMALAKNKHISGELEITYAYGRPGKLNNERAEKFNLRITTDEEGKVSFCEAYC